MNIINDIYITLKIADKCEKQDIEWFAKMQPNSKPKFGRCWWFTLPTISHNFKDTSSLDSASLSWLCFSIEYFKDK
jgi:hypothetical protein